MKRRIGSENLAELLNLDDDEQFFKFNVIAQALLKIIEDISLDLINHAAPLYSIVEGRRH